MRFGVDLENLLFFQLCALFDSPRHWRCGFRFLGKQLLHCEKFSENQIFYFFAYFFSKTFLLNYLDKPSFRWIDQLTKVWVSRKQREIKFPMNFQLCLLWKFWKVFALGLLHHTLLKLLRNIFSESFITEGLPLITSPNSRDFRICLPIVRHAKGCVRVRQPPPLRGASRKDFFFFFFFFVFCSVFVLNFFLFFSFCLSLSLLFSSPFFN